MSVDAGARASARVASGSWRAAWSMVRLGAAGALFYRANLALSVVSGHWRASHNLTSFTGDAVTMIRRDKRRGHITFDGEVERKAGPLKYGLLPKALRVIAARPASQ